MLPNIDQNAESPPLEKRSRRGAKAPTPMTAEQCRAATRVFTGETPTSTRPVTDLEWYLLPTRLAWAAEGLRLPADVEAELTERFHAEGGN